MNRFRIILHLYVLMSFSILAQTISPYIVVDQFGYMPNMKKVAVLRDPQTGYDASGAYTPASSIQLKDASTNTTVFSASPITWNSGNTDAVSGDKVWWFDFSTITSNGNYYVYDATNNARSATFVIADTVYKNVLKASVRMLFYQRAGCVKTATNAGAAWADGASHLGAGQDKNARLYSDKNNATTEKDLSGGWFDAGDYNKYTPWTANYVTTLMLAYKENKTIWTDDYNIPESGNGVPDVIDEAKWGIDWLMKMQQANGSCLSVMGVGHASPPSAATDASYYGLASANATFKTAAAFALASKVLKEVSPTKYSALSDTLKNRAIKAWNWGIANPTAKFNNGYSIGLAAGDQETDSLGRFTAKMAAALYLYELTGTATYKTIFENSYTSFPLIAWGDYLSQYFLEAQDLLMYYTTLSGTNSTIVSKIKSSTLTASKKTGDFVGALTSNLDPYRSFIKDYNWGSNQYKSNYGNFMYSLFLYKIDTTNKTTYDVSAADYLHYVHGVNPMQLVYLSNMSTYGAEKSVNEFYHTWFTDGSAKWDRVGTSTYGPAPGFLTGGANNSYSKDGCCPAGCGSTQNNNLCSSVSELPIGQPAGKSYKDFNTGWPLNSWSVTENSNGYQVAYIRLLSKYVKTSLVTDVVDYTKAEHLDKIWISPNPASDYVQIEIPTDLNQEMLVNIFAVDGRFAGEHHVKNGSKLDISQLNKGMYLLKIQSDKKWFFAKMEIIK